MFKLFGKKPAEKPAPTPEKRPELAAIGAQFLPEEFTILAVTGAGGFGGTRETEDSLWHASIELTAWMDEDEDGPVVREPAQLVALADDKLMTYLRQRIGKDSILRAKVRRAREDERFLLVDIPEPAMEPELKAILEEQKKPVTVADPELGVFTLERAMHWFAAEADWPGQPVLVTFDQEEEPEASLQTARALLKEGAQWDERLRRFAVDTVLRQVNEQEEAPLTGAELSARLEAESLQVCGDGTFTLWLRDTESAWGRSVRVSGSLTGGPAEAQWE